MRGLVLLSLLSFAAARSPRFGFGLPDIAGVPSPSWNPASFLSLSQLSTKSQHEIPSTEAERQAQPGSKVCLTKGCVKAAAELIESMDITVDPCSDFYSFACGNFLKETVIPNHQTSCGSISMADDKLNMRLRKIFEAEPLGDEPQAFQNVKNYYQACVNNQNIEENSVAHLMDILEKVGGWPVLMGEDWKGDDFKWHQLSARASDHGFSSDRMISIYISTDSKNSTKRILEIDQPSLGLSREYLIKGAEDKDVMAYLDYMVNSAVFLGANREVARVEMKEALDLELKIAAQTLPKEERRNETALYNIMAVKEVSALYPDMDWVEYINAILSPDRSVTIDENENVNVAVTKYIKEFKDLISGVPARTIANLIMWRNVKSLMSFLTEEATQIQLVYSKAITGQSSKSPRWEKCVKATATDLYYNEGSLTNAVGAMYAKAYFKEAAKDITDKIVVKIREEFKDMLDNLDWMDAETKQKAHKKADLMTSNMAYPKEILDDKLMAEFYDGLVLPNFSFLKNYLQLKTWISQYSANKFRNPIDNKSWKTRAGAAIVNAFYSPSENSINFPAGILDGVFFQEDRPLYMNYGAIGFVVGHEITHGFDDQGSQKNGEGNLVDWWKPETKQRYLEKAQCIIDQYSNYTVEVEGEILKINGINSQGENIADNGGVKEALLAYNRLTKRHGVEPNLPGINYSPRQLFWLSGARIWCNARRPAALKQQVLTDPHLPSQFRVNGPFSNLKEFSQDWGCSLGSPMNPVKKCEVW